MRSRQATEASGAASWTTRELARGTDRYRRYLAVFGLDEESFTGQAVCHIGCGPFGGMLSVLRDVAQPYRGDVDAVAYQQLGKCPGPLLAISTQTGRASVPAESCDAVFCLGVTGEPSQWYVVEREGRRLCKIGGRLYLWWRISDDPRHAHWKPDPWQRRPGRVLARWQRTGGLTVDRMRRVFRPIHWAWSQEGSGIDLPNLYPAVQVRWAVLTRVEAV